MKLCIFGSRGFTSNDNEWLFNESINLWVRTYGMPSEIVCGGCKGSPDEWGEVWGIDHDVHIEYFRVTKVDWDAKGKGAGPMRNSDMANYTDRALGFWDGKSRGTGDMILKMWAVKGSKDFVDVIFPDSIPRNILSPKKQLQ